MTMSPPVSQGSLTLHAAPAHHVPKSSNDSSALSTSFGAAGSALSLSSSVPASTFQHHHQRGQSIMPMSTISSRTSHHHRPAAAAAVSVNPDQEGAPHSHLGILCNLASSPPNSGSAILSQSYGSRSNVGGVKRTSSILNAEDDDEGSLLDGSLGRHGKGEIHKCETCSKVYRHPSCLVKHRWEHTIHWRESSKLSASKHQTVQLLEAAAILVGMESPARSLPEEKALWPAAVSPPSSGLLGSDKVNFVKLMASKPKSKFEQFVSATNQQHLATQHNNNNNIGSNGIHIRDPAASPFSTASELSISASQRAVSESSFGSATPTLHPGTLSPLNGLGNLALSSPPTRAHDPRNGGAPNGRMATRHTTKHPNMVGYIRTTSAPSTTTTNGLASGRTAAVTASTAGRASKKAAKATSSFTTSSSVGEEADADVRILHLDWDSSSHSDRTESDDRRSSGRSGSAETEFSATLASVSGGVGPSGVVGEKGAMVFEKEMEEEMEEEEEEEEEEEDLMADDDDEDKSEDDKDLLEEEEEDNSSRSFGDVDGMDAMEMDGVA
ncbi:unnamed protein product [Tilletia controversa]|nr:unnamed protein product [Tilletia controversa]